MRALDEEDGSVFQISKDSAENSGRAIPESLDVVGRNQGPDIIAFRYHIGH